MKLYTFILLALMNLCGYAQTEPIVVISPNHNNILYLGIEYTFDLYIANVKPEEVSVTGNSLMIRQADGLKYKVILSDSLMRNFSINININGKHLKTAAYQVGLLPSPIAFIGNKSSGKTSLEYILNHKIEFKLPLEYQSLNLNYSLAKYEVTIIPKDTTKQQPSYFMGDKADGVLSEYLLAIIKKSKSGDLITIYNIEALGPDKIGLVHIQEPLSITIE